MGLGGERMPDKQCEHKFKHISSSREEGVRPSFGMSPARDWKRTDHFYCEKCLKMDKVTQTEDGWKKKPDWF